MFSLALAQTSRLTVGIRELDGDVTSLKWRTTVSVSLIYPRNTMTLIFHMIWIEPYSDVKALPTPFIDVVVTKRISSFCIAILQNNRYYTESRLYILLIYIKLGINWNWLR